MNMDNQIHFSMSSQSATGEKAWTTAYPALGDASILCIEQENLDTRSHIQDDDMVVLDHDAQRALYEYLKEKFEKKWF